jgi:hypothetical protein
MFTTYPQIMTPQLAAAVRRELLELAHVEDDLAAAHAAQGSLLGTGPPSVQGHRSAAQALRAEADRIAA